MKVHKESSYLIFESISLPLMGFLINSDGKKIFWAIKLYRKKCLNIILVRNISQNFSNEIFLVFYQQTFQTFDFYAIEISPVKLPLNLLLLSVKYTLQNTSVKLPCYDINNLLKMLSRNSSVETTEQQF